jgi:hypothetical protein
MLLAASPELKLLAGQSLRRLWSKHFDVIRPSRGDSNVARVGRLILLICHHVSSLSSSDQIETLLIDLVNDGQFMELLSHFALALQGTQSQEDLISTDWPERAIIAENGNAWVQI